MPEPFVVQPRASAPRPPSTRPIASAPDPGAGAPRGAELGGWMPQVPARPGPRWPRHPSLAGLEGYLDDPAVTDLFVNGSAGLFVDRGGGPVAEPGWRADEEDVRELAVALISLGGRHIDDAKP